MDELSRKAAALRELANAPPIAETRSLVADALHDKFEGVQAVALDVLGAWGDPESLAALREFLKTAFTRKFGWAIRGVAVRNLIPHVSATDVDWILDLYFTRPDALTKHELVRLVIALPPEGARARLVAELRSPDRLNRQAAVKAIGNMPYSDRRQLLWPLREDSDAFVRKSARLLSEGAA
ncbi:MAG TPA: HEAT repeat domain-containing protein [Gemmatimonadaceae bacterium]|nr:HEAT repeat domain-containing protein [Gemmatimonadaceae bacterium]